MNKQDCKALAADIRKRVALWSPCEHTAGRWFHESQARMSESMQAAHLARYLADHLQGIDRAAFLQACGIRATTGAEVAE